jgi:hypothetical protein
METGPKAGTLSERLEAYFGHRKDCGIRVNEIRFVAEDAGFSEARVAATLTAKTLGADADKIQEWFRSPEKMIQLITAAEGAHGGSGAPGGSGSGAAGTSSAPGTFSAPGVVYVASSEDIVGSGEFVGFEFAGPWHCRNSASGAGRRCFRPRRWNRPPRRS